MRNKGQQLAQQLLDEIGGESLEGSGFEEEIPDPSFGVIDSNKERRHVE